MRKFFSVNLLYVLLMLLSVQGWGQVSLTNAANSVSIDFSNSTPTSVGSNPSTAYTAVGFAPNSATSGTLNSNAWAVTGWSDGALAFGGTRTTGDYARGAIGIAVGTGGFYAYTGSPASVANPTFMIQPGGSDFAPGTLTLKVKNNGTTNITSFAISYNLFVRNDQARSTSFNLSYSEDDVTYTPVPALDYTTPVAIDASGWVQVGSSPSRSNSGNVVSIAPGGSLYIRWSSADVAGSGSRDEIGLDDINITATFSGVATTPTKLAIINISPATPTVNSPFNVTVQAQDNSDGAANVTANTNVNLSVNTGTGSLGGTVSGTINAGSNTILISGVTYNVAESGVVLTATRSSGDILTAGNSSAFEVQPAPVEGLQVTSANMRFTIDFDNTVAGSNVGQFTGTTTSTNPATGELNSKAWSIDGTSAANPGAFTATSAGAGISTGGVTSGSFYAFETSTGNRSLGVQPTGSYFNPGNITLKIQNKSGAPITSLSLAYKLLINNDGGRSTTQSFSYSTDNVTYTDVAPLSLTSVLGADASVEWKAYVRSTTISSINIPADGYLYVRWAAVDAAGTGNRDEFAIDDISIVANSSSVNPAFSGVIQDAVINGNTTVTSATDVYQSLQVLAGSVLSVSNNLTLKSTATGTARIANSPGVISGNVTVERFIPANSRRAWRLLSAPLLSTGAPTIYDAWQEGGTVTSTGTHITQAGGAGTNGFDASTSAGASSIRYWNGAALLTPANTNTTKVTDNGGAYFLFVRGNRNIDLNNTAASSNTTLRMTGTINQGNVTAGVAGGGSPAFSLIPNPYPSPVDYEAIFGTNPFAKYYVWDAKNLGSTGGYRTIERTGANTYESTPSTGSPATDNEMRYIRSGQAIFVNGNTTFSFTEAMKTDMTPSTNVFRTGAGIEQMTIDLKVVGATTYLADGVRAKYSNSYSNMVNTEDIVKFNNFSENLGILRDGQTLAVEKRDLVDAADTIFLKLWNTGIKDYQFDINPTDFSPAANLNAVLVDNYLSTNTPVSLSGNTTYNFSVSSVAASAASDRFMIVFRPSAPLPVNFTQVKAYQKEAGIQVEWNVASEVDVVRYEVEKSINGTSFDKAGTITASNSKSYSWLDATPNMGANFYRIKVVNKDNSYQYSSVVNVKLDGIKGDIAVYPNPVKGSVINVQFNNLEKGTYTVQLINSLGQQVYSSKIVHQGGSSTQALPLNSSLTKGAYQLVISNGAEKTTLQVIVE